MSECAKCHREEDVRPHGSPNAVCFTCALESQLDNAQAENKKLEEKILNYEGDTHCCMQCEAYAKEIERLRKEFQSIVNVLGPQPITCRCIGCDEEMRIALGIAKSALEGGKGPPSPSPARRGQYD